MTAMDETLWYEDFSDGLDLSARWIQVATDEYTADGAVGTASESGLRLAPTGSHPVTGEPAFVKEGGPSLLARVQWLAATRQAFATAAPLRVTFRAGARAFGIVDHPYGDAVGDPTTDLRLAALGLNVMDLETGLGFAFGICHGAIYPYYERIPVPGDDGEAFGALRQPVLRASSAMHDLAVNIDCPRGTATWEVDGTIVGSTERMGVQDPAWTTVVHRAGVSKSSQPTQVALSLGLFTLLDNSLPPSVHGLVDLGLPYEHPKMFAGGPRLFGQGLEAFIERIEVTHS